MRDAKASDSKPEARIRIRPLGLNWGTESTCYDFRQAVGERTTEQAVATTAGQKCVCVLLSSDSLALSVKVSTWAMATANQHHTHSQNEDDDD